MKGKICSVREINDTSVTAMEAQKGPLWRNAALSILFILQARDPLKCLLSSPHQNSNTESLLIYGTISFPSEWGLNSLFTTDVWSTQKKLSADSQLYKGY